MTNVMRKRRLWFDLHEDAAAPQVAIVGLPYDGSISLKAGSALAPARLREISVTSDPIGRRGDIIESITLRDFGDINAGPSPTQRDFQAAAIAKLADIPKGSFVVSLGGDNSVSIPCLQSFAQRHGPDCGIIWFDAHPDLFEAYDGDRYSHASALRTAMTLGGFSPHKVVLLATRSYAKGEIKFIAEQGIALITAAEIVSNPIGAVMKKITAQLRNTSAVYLAIDIDGFDSAYAPGTGYPMAGGITSEQFFVLQELLFESLPLRAMDITEISPPLDHNDVTSFLGTQIILEALAALQRVTRMSPAYP